jgi:hypothetical protein
MDENHVTKGYDAIYSSTLDDDFFFCFISDFWQKFPKRHKERKNRNKMSGISNLNGLKLWEVKVVCLTKANAIHSL